MDLREHHGQCALIGPLGRHGKCQVSSALRVFQQAVQATQRAPALWASSRWTKSGVAGLWFLGAIVHALTFAATGGALKIFHPSSV